MGDLPSEQVSQTTAMWLTLLYAMIAIFVLYAIYLLIRFAIDAAPRHTDSKTVLISGCDTGFGQLLALKCLRAGMTVFAGCLTDEGMKGLEEEAKPILKAVHAKNDDSTAALHPILLDIRSQESVDGALIRVKLLLGERGLDGLVNNAGITGLSGWDDWLQPGDYENVWQVNTLGGIRLTHAAKSLIKQARGRIVIMSSSCGRVALSGTGPYNVSKFAVEAYGDTIRQELKNFGVSVALIEPGFFRTPLTNPERIEAMLDFVWNRTSEAVREDYGDELYAYSRKTTVEFLTTRCSDKSNLVVEAYYHALTSPWPRHRYQVGLDAKLLFIPLSFMPSWLADWGIWLSTATAMPKPKAMLLRRKAKK